MLYKNTYRVIDPNETILDSTDKDIDNTLEDFKRLVLQTTT